MKALACRVVGALLGLLVVAGPLAAEPLTLVWFTGSRGAAAAPACLSPAPTDPPSWRTKAALLAKLPAAGRIVIDHGPTFGPHPYLDALLTDEDQGAAALRAGLGEWRPDLALPGRDDFLLTRPGRRETLATHLAALGWQARALNVRCADTARCGHLQSEPLVWSGAGVRMAFLPVLLEEVEGRVLPAALAGVTIEPHPLPLIKRAIARLRAEGVERFVLVARVGSSSGRLPLLHDLLARLPEVGLALSDGGGAALLTSRDAKGRLRQINLDASPTGIVRVRVDPLGGLDVQEVEVLPRPAGEPRANAFEAGFCRRWGAPLTTDVPEATFWEPEAFVAYLLDLFRTETASEVALLNRRAVRTRFLRAHDGEGLTRGLLQGVLPFENQVTTLLVPGKSLGELLARVMPTTGDPRGVRVAGVTRDNGAWLVNGRPLDDVRLYRVVTNDFLLDGGDGFVPQAFRDALTGRNTHGTLRDVAEAYFRERRYVRFGAIARGTFPDLGERPLWTFRGMAGLSAQHVTTRNPVGYTESQLQRDPLLQVLSTLEGHALMETLSHRWRSYLSARYGKSGADWGDLGEFDDLAVLETSYEWMGWRRLARPGLAWLVPNPTARARSETEFERGEGAPYRHLQGSTSAGLTWQVWAPLTLFVGYGISRELLAPGDAPTHGLSFGYLLAPWEHGQGGGRKLTLTSRFDGTLHDPAGAAELRGLGSTAFGVTLLGPLALAIRYDLFLYRQGSAALAYHHGASLGLILEAIHVWQSF